MTQASERILALSLLCDGFVAATDPSWLGEGIARGGIRELLAGASVRVQRQDWWESAIEGLSLREASVLFSPVGPATERLVQAALSQSPDGTSIEALLVSEAHIELRRYLTAQNQSALASIRAADEHLISLLKAQPDSIYQLPPRTFELLVAELLEDMGCRVTITPETRDGGRDILAFLALPFGEILTIVECKRFRFDRPVGIGIVERFLWTVERHDRASLGLLATTSHFSPEATATADEYRYRLKLADFNLLKEWIGTYGTWGRSREQILWVPPPMDTGNGQS